MKGFSPKELTSRDRQQGSCFMSQYPSHSDRTTSRDDVFQRSSQPQNLRNMHSIDSSTLERDDEDYSSGNKKARYLGNASKKHPSCDSTVDNFSSRMNHAESNVTENNKEFYYVVPDVAAAIEDLLEQTSKIQDLKCQETSGCHENFLTSNAATAMLGQMSDAPLSEPVPPNQWINRSDERILILLMMLGQGETQTDSQLSKLF